MVVMVQDENLVHFSDYTEEQVLPVFRLMIDYLIRPVKHQAFFKKYASKKFMKGIYSAIASVISDANVYLSFSSRS
jgi:hypothetical protein